MDLNIKPLKKLFNDIFSNDIDTLHRIKNINVDDEGLTIKNQNLLFFSH